jgi:hypothetical protein
MSENLVIVRAFGGKPLVRAVLEMMPGGVLVCMPEHADAIRRGELSRPLVGFPNEDVFLYDAQAIGVAGNVNWERLAHMREAAN